MMSSGIYSGIDGKSYVTPARIRNITISIHLDKYKWVQYDNWLWEWDKHYTMHHALPWLALKGRLQLFWMRESYMRSFDDMSEYSQ